MKALLVLTIFALTSKILIAQTASDNPCIKKENYGNIEVCLPEINGMVECYETDAVKARVKRFDDANPILGYYITEQLFSQMDRFEVLFLDEYFKIYVVDKLKDTDIGEKEWEEISNFFDENYMSEKWENMKAEIENRYENLKIGMPVIIESYELSENSKTYLMVSRVVNNDKEYVILMTMNLVEVKDRLIWIAYYKSYEDENSIGRIKSGSDHVVKVFMKANEN